MSHLMAINTQAMSVSCYEYKEMDFYRPNQLFSSATAGRYTEGKCGPAMTLQT